ncbi:hypothetical protein U9M48_032258 [Paspalum notatum var. saurae]|uniref:Uncharacterized protein n=1 Tax=Paspalum notatum var. saurae TaxID=547442 RepID=A0AAQ3U6Y2_PASNO
MKTAKEAPTRPFATHHHRASISDPWFAIGQSDEGLEVWRPKSSPPRHHLHVLLIHAATVPLWIYIKLGQGR